MSSDSLTANHVPAFADPVHDAQRTFRVLLEAMARPTLPRQIPPVADGSLHTPGPMPAAVGAVLLTLCDEHTSIWLDDTLGGSDEVRLWLRFHTGAKLVDDPAEASFVVATPASAPRLIDLAQGTDEEPHRSATLVLDATDAAPTMAFVATGPGVNGRVDWLDAALPADFADQWAVNHDRFPQGVDVFVVDADTVRALPRTTNLERKAD
ncbi:MAG: phosphonate C-P lyase system protein PhnH [Propionibacterium sp.]|nr:phosphonate C-P lyase system protein PhnH [Propionibacterium sp.]